MKAKGIGCLLIATMVAWLSGGCSLVDGQVDELSRWARQQPGVKKEQISWATVDGGSGGLPDGHFIKLRAKNPEYARQAVTDFARHADEHGVSKWRLQIYWKVSGGDSGIQLDSRPGAQFDVPFEMAQAPLPPHAVIRIVDGAAPGLEIQLHSKPGKVAKMAAALTVDQVGGDDVRIMLSDTNSNYQIRVGSFANLQQMKEALVRLDDKGVQLSVHPDSLIASVVAKVDELPAIFRELRQLCVNDGPYQITIKQRADAKAEMVTVSFKTEPTGVGYDSRIYEPELQDRGRQVLAAWNGTAS